MKPEAVTEFYRRLAAATPAPETELHYANVYQLLVAVVLSAQATDVGVNRATGPLFAKIRTPAEMVALGEERLRDFIKTIGLFNTKAKNVIALSKILVERHGGEVPRTREALQALPGVGRKTANVVLNVAFEEATIAVDTHIFRVGNRTGLARGKTPDKVEAKLEKATQAADSADAEATRLLVIRENWLAAQLELIGDPPAPTMHPVADPEPEDEENAVIVEGEAGSEPSA